MAAYSDIYNYTPGFSNNIPTTGGGENGQGQYTPFDWQTGDPMQGFNYHAATNDSSNPYWSYDTPDKYQGILSLEMNNDPEHGGSAQWNNNYRALPNQGMTKYGPVESTIPYMSNSKLANPNMYYDDPYYGRITSQNNLLPDKDIIGSLIPKLVMAAGSAWMGSLAAPDLFGGKALWSLGNAAGKYGIAAGGGGGGGVSSGGINMSNGDLYNQSSKDKQSGDTMAGNSSGGDLSSPDYFNQGGSGAFTNSDPYISGGGNGGGFLGNAFNSIINGVGQGDNQALAGALTGPAAIAAWKQYNDAGKYRELGQTAADRADPFGPNRAGYATRLQNTYDHPEDVLNDPQHQAVVQKQMNAINSRNRASGYEGGGKNSMDLADYQAQSDAQYLNQERDQLGNLSGAQFNPANAGAMLMKGGELAMNSENMALGTAMSPYTAYLQGQYGGNRVQPGGSYPGGVGPGGTRFNIGGGNPGQYITGPNGPNISGVGTPGYGGGSAGYPPYPTRGPIQEGYGEGYTNPDSVYGPNSGWGQDVINPSPDLSNIYGPNSGWGQDLLGKGGGSYIPEGGGDMWSSGGFDFGDIWGGL